MPIPPTPSGPSGAIAAAMRGLHRAGLQAGSAAARIAASGAPPPESGGPGSGRAAVEAALAAPDLAAAAVDLIAARQAYAANAAVLRGADAMAEELARRTA